MSQNKASFSGTLWFWVLGSGETFGGGGIC